jgi:hypothetical protein
MVVGDADSLASRAVIQLDAATVLLQWSSGGLAFLWVTTRRREVGLGYGWLLRGVYLVMAAGALVAGLALDTVPLREVASGVTAAAACVALVMSVVRRRAGVAGQRGESARKQARVQAMVSAGAATVPAVPSGTAAPVETASPGSPPQPRERLTDEERFAVTGIELRDAADRLDPAAPEFPPGLDLVAPLCAVVGLVAAGVAAADGAGAGDAALAVARTVVGAAFLGAVSDAMLLGHWYLVQPGLARGPLLELVRWTGAVWPFEVALLLVPTGMVSVWNGSIDDGYGGMLGWFWAACAVTTIGLVFVTRAALKERAYSAVMAATGLLYLAILTAFGTDLVARAVLAG